MAVDLRGVTVVLLPGTGSDDDYVYRAFSPALHDVGAAVVAPAPEPDRLVAGYLRELDDAARPGPDRRRRRLHRRRRRDVVGAGPPGPGSRRSWPRCRVDRRTRRRARRAGRQYTAHLLRSDGLASAIAQMRASSPPWLADELTRSWVGQWPALPDAMDEAAALRRADGRRARDAGRPDGRRGGDRRPGAPRRGGARVGGRGAPRGAADLHTRRDRRRSRRPRRGVRGRACRSA